MTFRNPPPSYFLYFGAGFIVVVLFIWLFYMHVNKELIATEVANVSLAANQQQAAINASVLGHASALKRMPTTLQIIWHDKDVLTNYLQNFEKTLGVDNVILADTHGIGQLSNLNKVDVTENKAFQAALEGKTHVTAPFFSKYTGKEVIAAATPMQSDDAITGAVIIEFPLEYIKKTFISIVDQADATGYSLLVDKHGNVLASTHQKDKYFIPFQNDTFENGLTYKEHLQQLVDSASKTVSSILHSDTESRILEFRPIKLNDWSVIVVSDDVSSTLIRTISEGIKYLLVGIVLSFCFFLAVTMYLRHKGVKDIEKVAFYDELTGLPNLVYFKEKVKVFLKEHPDVQFAMQKMDIKNFKAINEMFGHEVGNLVIQTLAKTILASDDETFICARVDADEFIIFSKNASLAQDKKSKEAHEAHFKSLIPELAEHEFVFRYGRYVVENNADDIMEIINKTNMAHRMAKMNKEHKIYEYDENYKKRILRMAEITNKRKNAIKNNEFKVYLQPKMNIFAEKICGAEALVRWIEPDGTMIYPNEFIPLFEQNGFIVNVDMYILTRVCRQIKVWLQAGYAPVPISVNFSRMHLQNANFVQDLKNVCDSYGDIRQYIEVELTESAATENVDELERILNELHEAGFSVAIDDFGAGYSSLGMLKNFTVDCLKLDKSFFDEHEGDTRGNIVVRNIIRIAKTLGMKIVAEGIETAEQVEFLKSVQCEIVQGYYYGKPMPLSEFEQSYMGEYDATLQ